MMQSVMSTQAGQDYIEAFRGRFTSLMRWPQLDAFWSRLRERAGEGWYNYAVGEQPPAQPASVDRAGCRALLPNLP